LTAAAASSTGRQRAATAAAAAAAAAATGLPGALPAASRGQRQRRLPALQTQVLSLLPQQPPPLLLLLLVGQACILQWP
jgi:hypothetical protein